MEPNVPFSTLFMNALCLCHAFNTHYLETVGHALNHHDPVMVMLYIAFYIRPIGTSDAISNTLSEVFHGFPQTFQKKFRESILH